jgi:hypothetical protein
MFRLGFVYLGRAAGKILAADGAHMNKDSALRFLYIPRLGRRDQSWRLFGLILAVFDRYSPNDKARQGGIASAADALCGLQPRTGKQTDRSAAGAGSERWGSVCKE